MMVNISPERAGWSEALSAAGMIVSDNGADNLSTAMSAVARAACIACSENCGWRAISRTSRKVTRRAASYSTIL